MTIAPITMPCCPEPGFQLNVEKTLKLVWLIFKCESLYKAEVKIAGSRLKSA